MECQYQLNLASPRKRRNFIKMKRLYRTLFASAGLSFLNAVYSESIGTTLSWRLPFTIAFGRLWQSHLTGLSIKIKITPLYRALTMWFWPSTHLILSFSYWLLITMWQLEMRLWNHQWLPHVTYLALNSLSISCQHSRSVSLMVLMATMLSPL